jgi:hypothetical protein
MVGHQIPGGVDSFCNNADQPWCTSGTSFQQSQTGVACMACDPPVLSGLQGDTSSDHHWVTDTNAFLSTPT